MIIRLPVDNIMLGDMASSNSFLKRSRLAYSLPLGVLEVTQHFMREPVRILVKKDELTLEGIKQFYIAVDREDWKLDTLCDLYETLTITQAKTLYVLLGTLSMVESKVPLVMLSNVILKET